jgi:hypothetical protein
VFCYIVLQNIDRPCALFQIRDRRFLPKLERFKATASEDESEEDYYYVNKKGTKKRAKSVTSDHLD